jgi:NTP pyrophosphatase (non-canonical NTP hydrolase)
MKPYNNLTNKQAELLDLLSEELGEAIQAIGKIKRYGYNSISPTTGLSNIVSLEKELGDILAAINLLTEYSESTRLNWDLILHNKRNKLKTVGKWLHHYEDIN